MIISEFEFFYPVGYLYFYEGRKRKLYIWESNENWAPFKVLNIFKNKTVMNTTGAFTLYLHLAM